MISAQQVAQWESETSAMRARIVTAENKAEHYRQEAERLRAALRECAADWKSSPGTIMGAAAELGREFKRRMQIAGNALNDGPTTEG